MALSSSQIILLCAVGIVLLARPAHAFGAGNIGSTSKIEGQNWRHGDLEDTLLTIVASRAMGGKKFSKLDVKRVYFGNWLRDYSQAVDVGTVKYVSAEAIRILLWVLGFMSFGYGSGEFEVTSQRLGCYRPEEHIDNPKDYADNQDARQYDRRLRGPVDERRELSINPQTGLKNYIASEGMGIDTSAGLVRKLFGRSIELGRQYARSKNKKDLYEALRLLGTGSHCLEDYAAHSNYVELALVEMGERDVFPHVGRRTAIQLREVRHPVYPIVTGTFGGVDFLHSVCGEFDDKTTQSEIQELNNTLQQYQNGSQDNSILQDLLNKLPSGLFGGKDQAGKANELQQNALNHQMQNAHITPRQPEQWTRYLDDVQRQIYPIIEWHDEIMQSITETIEKIPILPDLIEQIQDQINKFVFSLLAPFVVPIINQVKTELNTGSNEIIQSSLAQQHIVFNDDNSSDPTHSMLSKDHFSNILNEPAGKVAHQTVKWVVPQIVACWDDERIDVERTLNRIIHGVLHHPALRDYGQDGAGDGRRIMFGVVEEWWRGKSASEKDGLREQLSRRGVETGRNHKPGVQDHGHGNNRPLGMANLNFNTNQVSSGGIAGGALGAISSALGGDSQSGGGGRPPNVSRASDQLGKMAGAAVGGGVLGSLVGGLTSQIGGDILGGGLSQGQETYKRDTYNRQDGSVTETVTQLGQSSSGGHRYGQAQYSRTTGPSGERRYEEYNRFEQRGTASGGWQSEVHHQERTAEGRYHEETRRYGDNDNDSPYGERRQEHHRPKHHPHRHEEDDQHSRYEHEQRRDQREEDPYSASSYASSGRRQQQFERESSGYGGSESYGRRQEHEYGRRHDEEYGGSGYGRHHEQRRDRDEYSSSGGAGYGGGRRREEESTTYGGGGSGGYGRADLQEESRYESSGFGGGSRRDEESSNYGSGFSGGGGGGYGRRQQEVSTTYDDMPGGFGSTRQDEYSSFSGGGRGDEYGGGRDDGGYAGGGGGGGGFGRRGEYGGENEGYGGDNGEGEGEGEGEGRRRYRESGDNEEYGSGYGGGGGYGSSRY
ncbi:uncharacterized protein Z520_02607 [Fonsecaea multimorphosa CBS 102226]|uniref:Het-C-domain-containing protein n=1 Tax=Fonsecaea multimorphosa CBS 102226 TaxID=1442371 RepID=A0A0D2K8T3_9EURO|nr:uncharacterized protein Z520_02607 [Fonsecaea multimorphosa CBS 102226]KIY02468.1 hypothetical protein Z520_02607 [Fonsecaea multimorphosa CBS 102226]OAL29107.1 hypothetical protein AYO22_02544 [Fonsecaea multimorphosa]